MPFLHISHGGPMRKISVDGKIYEFEMHRYCGPTLLDRNGSPRTRQPRKFLEAASLWAQQGERIEGGLCRWDHPLKAIIVTIGGKHKLIIGYTKPEKGR